MSKTNKLKIIDLFCGAGGLSCGFMKGKNGAHFESVLALDNDKAAIRTYNANFGTFGYEIPGACKQPLATVSSALIAGCSSFPYLRNSE
ncbi:DNA cytosine methyltransferase [Enterobacter hormaechei]|uniref:DNA cytosine methyltransferase n=1 Tax=Enterobacter hormaechei TaxID=158836 RepID=UPI003F6A83FE